SSEIGVTDNAFEAAKDSELQARILVVDDRASFADKVDAALAEQHIVEIETDPQQALFRAAETDYDLVLLSLDLKDFDALRLVGQSRWLERPRHLPILLVTDPGENTRLLRGLDLGANDYILRTSDKNELIARVRTQIRRKRYTERLRDNLQYSMELAV